MINWKACWKTAAKNRTSEHNKCEFKILSLIASGPGIRKQFKIVL